LNSWIEVYKVIKQIWEIDESRSAVLEFMVETLNEFGVDQAVVSLYRTLLEHAKKQEIDKPEDLRRKIVHIEADMECTAELWIKPILVDEGTRTTISKN